MNGKNETIINENMPSLDDLQKTGILSRINIDKIKLTKSIIEKKYQNKENQYFKILKTISEIKNYLNTITIISDKDKEELKKSISKKINENQRLLRQKISLNKFKILSQIGKGAFGKVNICKDKDTNEFFAIKQIKCDLIKSTKKLFQIKTEKDILSLSNNDIDLWKSKLFYSFIEDENLYLITDYFPGGDLLHLMNKKDTFSEKEARFYIAEIILCVENIHKLNCIHRDIKPDNIFIDKNGHLKLGDFGLSFISEKINFPYTNNKKNKLNEIIANSDVGSLLYVAPEIFDKKGYGPEVDWWGVGSIFYEMLIGYPPFWNSEDTPQTTYYKLKNFKKYLEIPEKYIKISPEAKKLILDFLCDAKNRLGKNGIDEIKKHPFFKNFDWENVRKMKAPFIPELDPEIENKYYFINEKIRPVIDIKLFNKCNINKINNNFDKNNNNINWKFYDFNFNINHKKIKDQLYNSKYFIDMIKKEIENKYCTNNTDEISTDEYSFLKSNESLIAGSNIKITNKKFSFTKERFHKFDSNNDEIVFDNIKKNENISLRNIFNERKKSLKIIPIKNILNKSININKSRNRELKNNFLTYNNSDAFSKDWDSTNNSIKTYNKNIKGKNNTKNEIIQQKKKIIHRKNISEFPVDKKKKYIMLGGKIICVTKK